MEDIIAQLNTKFGKESLLSTTLVKVLEYLGMTLDYSTKGKVKISIHKYIEKMLTEFPLDMTGVSKMPAATHLFNVNPQAMKLLEDKVQLFRHLEATLLYLCRQT